MRGTTISHAVEHRDVLESLTGDELLELAYDLLSYVECLWNAIDTERAS